MLLLQHQIQDYNWGAFAVFFIFGGLLGFVFRNIPVIRWVAAGAWLYVALLSPILIAWWTAYFWMAYGFAIVFLLRWKDRMLAATTFDLAFPSVPSLGGKVSYCIRKVVKILWWCIKVLGLFVAKVCCIVLYDLPLALMRLGFWLSNTIPKLRTREGWWLLFKGLFLWLWYLLPWQLRAEWARLKQG